MDETTHIWVLTEHRDQAFTAESFGLIRESQRLADILKEKVLLTAVLIGNDFPPEPERLGEYGVDRVLCIGGENSSPSYDGELFSQALLHVMDDAPPKGLLAVQSENSADLCARLAALLRTCAVTHAMDLKMNFERGWVVTRPVANGYLFEEVLLTAHQTAVVCFVPSVLMAPEKIHSVPAAVSHAALETVPFEPATEILEVIEADPETLDIEEADIVVAGGRGMGEGEAFHVIYELAKTLGGSVGGTRPVIDRHLLPYDRQIGQTGKAVSPRLLINCGISGANEYTAGIEASRLVIAINNDSRSRIFRFADLGVVADVHELLPLLIQRLREILYAS